MKKRWISLLMALCLLCSCTVTANATTETDEPAADAADELAAWEAELGEFTATPVNAYTPTSAENLLQAADSAHAYTPDAMAEEETAAAGDYAEGEVLYARSSRSGGIAMFSRGRGGDTVDDELAALGVTNAEALYTVAAPDDGIALLRMGEATTTWYRAQVEGSVLETVEALKEIDGITAAEPNYLYTADSIGQPEELERTNSWFLTESTASSGLNALNGWTTAIEKTNQAPGTGAVVAVIDTGVDYTHEDLAASMWVNDAELNGTPGVDDDGNGYIDDIYGINTTTSASRPTDPMDDNGHGTHVAGIIAMANNGKGGVGIAYGAKIMAIKAGQSTGTFSSADIVEAIQYAVSMGADVINMSFGGTGRSALIEDALETAFSTCVLVASAGNNGLPTTDAPDDFVRKEDVYPAGYRYVLGVMASDEGGQLAGFSNWDYKANQNAEYELIAPGTNVYSTLPGNRYASWNGTSMAAPCVSAAAAVLRGCYGDKNEYNSRFIMGQLASATESRTSYTDAIGGSHSYPKLDLQQSLTKLPKPNLSVSQVFALDNTETSSSNDGDRIIDAGETVELGVALRNQWGKTTDITVKADAVSDGGVVNPYVTFETDTVTLEPIGAYSEGDNGFAWEDGYLGAVTTPITFTLSPDTPNDAEIRIHLTVTTHNGWDGNDNATYTAEESFTFRVQNGRGIRGHITEDTTLTADTFWIVENALLVDEGVTLTVEPGTQIQFWSSDYEDAYGELTMAHLNNSGTLNMIGTEDAPIEIFPGAGFEKYAVEIAGSGEETLEYCRIVNARLGYLGIRDQRTVDLCQHCELWQAVAQPYIRYLDDGKVTIDSTWFGNKGFAVHTLANSSLHDFSGQVAYVPRRIEITESRGNLFDSCSVINGYTDRPTALSHTDSVFLGGASRRNTTTGSRFTVTKSVPTADPVFSAPMSYEGGSSKYVMADRYLQSEYFQYPFVRELMQTLAAELGGGLLILNSSEEENAITQWLYDILEANRQEGDTGNREIYAFLDYTYDAEQGAWVWGDDSDYAPYADTNYRTPLSKYCYGYYGVTSYPTTLSRLLSNTDSTYESNRRYVLEFPADTEDEEINTLLADFDYALWKQENLLYNMTNSAILNPILDTDTDLWTQFVAASYSSKYYYPLAYNYWGTENKTLINRMIQDDDDFTGTLADIREDPILTLEDDLSDIYPFVTRIWLTEQGGTTEVEEAAPGVSYDVHVSYNRDMDTGVQPAITYGGEYPFTDYRVYGNWKNAREWVGTTKISSVCVGGNQIFRAVGGRAEDDGWLVCGTDELRFQFHINAAAAQSVVLNAAGNVGKVELTWAQNDYEVLGGYNLYRSTSATGKFTRLNDAMLSATTYTDTDVEPGVTYYYYFTVVDTDGNEISDARSNVASATPKDTEKPVITHTPVTEARAGASVSVSANVTDNIAVGRVTLCYRTAGAQEYSEVTMSYNSTTKKYTATIPAAAVTTAGVEYYIEAMDNNGNYAFNGSQDTPNLIRTDATPTLLMAQPSTVDVSAEATTITVYGAHLTEDMTVKLGAAEIETFTVSEDGKSFSFTAPQLPIGSYSLAITVGDKVIRLANAVTYCEAGSYVQINSGSVLSGKTLRLPVYAKITGELTAFHAEVTIPTDAFSNATVELAEDVSASMSKNYSGGKLCFSLAGSSSFNPGHTKPLAYLVLTPKAVQTETAAQLTLTSGRLNGAETVTSETKTSVTIYPNFAVNAMVKYFKDSSIPVSGVTVKAGNVSAVTDSTGKAALTDINRADVTLIASRTDAAAGAVGANDASLALQHSVGLITLDSNQLIAGDVNGDGTVNEVDASLILKMAVQLIDHFDAGSWAFVPATKSVTLTSTTTTVSFTAILIGDIDGSWKGNAQ